MTVNAFLEFFNFDNSIQSSEKINYGEIEIPKYALEETVDEPGNKEFNYYSYNSEEKAYDMRRLYWDEGFFTHYLYHFRASELCKLLNSGNLYKHILAETRKANKIIDDCVALMAQDNSECQLALKNNDTEHYKKLLNNLRLIVSESVYRNMVLVF